MYIVKNQSREHQCFASENQKIRGIPISEAAYYEYTEEEEEAYVIASKMIKNLIASCIKELSENSEAYQGFAVNNTPMKNKETFLSRILQDEKKSKAFHKYKISMITKDMHMISGIITIEEKPGTIG